MQLNCITTGSHGNAFFLRANDGETLLIECGTTWPTINKAINGIAGVVGCLITHEHADHAKCASSVAKYGVQLYCSQGTKCKLRGFDNYTLNRRVTVLTARRCTRIGNFTVMPFTALHDAEEPFGYMIHHLEMGTMVFATDTRDIPQTFVGVNHWVVECNYIDRIMAENCASGLITAERMDRTANTHMSLRTLSDIIKRHAPMNTVVLIHLSGDNSSETEMVKAISRVAGCSVYASNDGSVYDLKYC